MDEALKRLARMYAAMDRLLEYEDMLQVARIAAWRSESTYDPHKGTSRQTWALRKANGAILVMRKRARRSFCYRVRAESYDAPGIDLERRAICTRDFVPYLIDVMCPEPKVEPIRPVSSRERQILRDMGSGKTAQAYAGEIGITRQTLNNILSRVYRKLGVHTLREAVKALHDAS